MSGGGIMLGQSIAFSDPEKEVAIELPDGTIRGRVVDASGSPLSGAVASAEQQFSKAGSKVFARNRPDGTFVLENVEPGSWEVVAASDDGRSESVTISVDSGNAEGVTLLLEPIRPIVIHIVDITGAPIRDALVAVEFPREGIPPLKSYIDMTNERGAAEFRLSRSEQAGLVNVVVATQDLRLSCALRRLDGDQMLTVEPVGGEVRVIGRAHPPGAQSWLISATGCGVPFLGTHIEFEPDGQRSVVFPHLAGGRWSYVETRNAEELARVLTGRAASLTPLKTFLVEPG